jgi:hypothetical protein
MRRVAVQLMLAFLEASPPQPRPSVKIDAKARAEAIKTLARMIAAQSVEANKQMETTDD